MQQRQSGVGDVTSTSSSDAVTAPHKQPGPSSPGGAFRRRQREGGDAAAARAATSPTRQAKAAALSLLDRPVHKARDSLFSSTSGFTNFRGFFNWGIIILVVSNFRVALENLIKYGILFDPLALAAAFTHDPYRWPNALLWIAANLFLFAAFAVELKLAPGSACPLTQRAATCLYVLLLTSVLLVPVVVILCAEYANPFFAAATLMLYTIIWLKLISYAHVNHWARKALLAQTQLQAAGAPKTVKHLPTLPPGKVAYPANLTLHNLYYFILAPTLCYELNFPKTQRIRKGFVIRRLSEVVGLLLVVVVLAQQWVVPLLKNSMEPFSEMDIGRMMERLLKLAVPNHIIWLICFYWGFHGLLNLIAELIHFADREFYRDWWNAETISGFWQSWNIPVHRWCHRHLYKPMLRSGYSTLTASLTVFLMSAFFHEFVVSVPLKMFRLYAFWGMCAQLPLSLLTDKFRIVRFPTPLPFAVKTAKIMESAKSQNNQMQPNAASADGANLQQLTGLIQSVLQQTQDNFQGMSDQIIKRIDDMTKRIDDLEKNIDCLMTQAGVDHPGAPPSAGGGSQPGATS